MSQDWPVAGGDDAWSRPHVEVEGPAVDLLLLLGHTDQQLRGAASYGQGGGGDEVDRGDHGVRVSWQTTLTRVILINYLTFFQSPQ